MKQHPLWKLRYNTAHNDVDMILPQFTPIELPSDEEISKQAEDADDNDLSPIEEWERGAKWMKEQILNQNK